MDPVVRGLHLERNTWASVGVRGAYADLERWRRATRAARESHPGAFFQAYGADRCIVRARRRLRDGYE